MLLIPKARASQEVKENLRAASEGADPTKILPVSPLALLAGVLSAFSDGNLPISLPLIFYTFPPKLP